MRSTKPHRLWAQTTCHATYMFHKQEDLRSTQSHQVLQMQGQIFQQKIWFIEILTHGFTSPQTSLRLALGTLCSAFPCSDEKYH